MLKTHHFLESDRGETAYDIPYMWILKRNDTNEQKETHKRMNLWLSGVGVGGREGIVREFGMDVYTLPHLKWITNKDLLYSTGNSARF